MCDDAGMLAEPMNLVMPVNADEIKRRRLDKGWSMIEAAEHAGMSSRQSWYNIESGRRSDPTVSTLQRIARALSCGVDDLLKDLPDDEQAGD